MDQDSIKGYNRQGPGKESCENGVISNDEDELRRGLGIDPEVDASEATGGMGDTG